MTKQQEIEQYLTLEELSEKTGLTVKFLRKAKDELGLTSYKFGRLVRIKMSDFIEWSEQRRVRVS